MSNLCFSRSDFFKPSGNDSKALVSGYSVQRSGEEKEEQGSARTHYRNRGRKAGLPSLRMQTRAAVAFTGLPNAHSGTDQVVWEALGPATPELWTVSEGKHNSLISAFKHIHLVLI